jgi:hypothetical protein
MVGGRRRTRDMRGRRRGSNATQRFGCGGQAQRPHDWAHPGQNGAPREHNKRCTARRAGQAGTDIVGELRCARVTLRRTELPGILAKFSNAAAHGAPARRLSPASGAYRRPPTSRACTRTLLGKLSKSGSEWRAHGRLRRGRLATGTGHGLRWRRGRDGTVLISRRHQLRQLWRSLSRQNGPSAGPSSVTQLSGGSVGSTTTYPRRCGPALARHHSARRHR